MMKTQTSKMHKKLDEQLGNLKLSYFSEHYDALAKEAIRKKTGHLEYLQELVRGEWDQKHKRSIERRIKAARFPVIKTIEQFKWEWPEKIDREQVEYLFHLRFVPECSNVIFLGTVGLGKSHLATALAYKACLEGYRVLFTNAIDVINTLNTAQKQGRLKDELKKYLKPELIILDELGYLPIDQKGADHLFQVISQRYERGSIILTTNKAFKDWPSIFNNDSVITSAVLDRILHHSETVLITGKSYRMKRNNVTK